MSVAARIDGDHFELPAEAGKLLLRIRPEDRQWFIAEVTRALEVASETKDFGPLQSGRCKRYLRRGRSPSASSGGQIMRRSSSGCSAVSAACQSTSMSCAARA
ncbi:MAG TPA: hypothetical protein VG276_15315 [Actinomycetes bacterium]|nr:hypothetical protein [Actinomycetes bacterium]